MERKYENEIRELTADQLEKVNGGIKLEDEEPQPDPGDYIPGKKDQRE